MGILMGIISFIFGLCVNLLDSAVVGFLELFSFKTTAFYAVFPFASNISDVFTACGLAVLMIGFAWQVFKGFGTPFGIEAENPLALVGKVGFCWFLVVNTGAITDLITKFFSIVLEELQAAPLGASIELEGFFVQMANSLLVGVTGIGGMLYLIIMLMLGYKFLKLLIEAVERYIVYCFICFIAPLFVSFGAFKSSRNITETWFKAFFGQSLLIILNVWSVRMFMSFLNVYNQHFVSGMSTSVGYLSPIIIMFMGMAFLNFAMRIDSFLRILGLNTAHTGSSLMQGLGGGAMKLLMAANTIQRLGGGGKSTATNTATGGSSTVNNGNSAVGGTVGSAGGVGTARGSAGATSGSSSSENQGVGVPAGLRGVAAKVADSKFGLGGGLLEKAGLSQKLADAFRGGSAGNSGEASAVPFSYGSGNKPSDAPVARGANRIMDAENALQSLRGKQVNPDSSNGLGGTNSLGDKEAKKTLVNAGVAAAMGHQERLADNNIGSAPQNIGVQYKQDALTASAVRSAATSAERDPSTGMPVASFEGKDAAAAMVGTLAPGNEKVANFQYDTNPDDGNSYISGLTFKDGGSATFTSIDGGVGEFTYTDADGKKSQGHLISDEAVTFQNSQVAAGTPGFKVFDTEASVGRVGNGSGSGGFYVVPSKPPTDTSGAILAGYSDNPTESIKGFVGNCPSEGFVQKTYNQSMVDRMREQAGRAGQSTPQTRFHSQPNPAQI